MWTRSDNETFSGASQQRYIISQNESLSTSDNQTCSRQIVEKISKFGKFRPSTLNLIGAQKNILDKWS